jgi:phosphate-selective porin OprO and OprP
MFVTSRLIRAAAVAALTALPGVASGQTPDAAAKPPASQGITAGWNDGFFIQSADGSNRLQFGLVLQADGRFSFDDPRPITNTFVMRKARPTLTGRVAKYFDFKLMPELAGGTALLLDGYFDIRFSPAFRLRSGKDKTPVGYELLLGDATLIFTERSVVSLLVPNRDVGFAAHGELAGGRVLYSGGVYNGNPFDGSSTIVDVDTNDSKDLAGRVVFLPFRSASTPASRWNNLGFHLGGSTGTQTGALPTFRTSVGQSYFSFASTTADGTRNRVSPAAFLYLGRFGGFAEYARSTSEVVRNQVPFTITNDACGVSGSYVLTGEATSDRGVRPRAPFDPAAGQWGAIQIAARYAQISIDDKVFTGGLAAANSSRKATQLSVGANWFLNNYVKIYGNYERFTFDGGDRANENVVIFRSQLAF